jgi:hypothetical protein
MLHQNADLNSSSLDFSDVDQAVNLLFRINQEIIRRKKIIESSTQDTAS